MAISDFLRYLVLTIVGLFVLGFGLKLYGKHKAEKEIVAELQSLTSASSSFEQFYEADAHVTLYRSMHFLRQAEERLEKSPTAILEKVFGIKKGGMFEEDDDDTPLRNQIVIDGLVRNYENCKRLGVFKDSLGREALAGGESPQIQTGPAAGKFSIIKHIIDPKVAPGVEKIVPNLVIAPPAEKEDPPALPTDFEIAAALDLIESLEYSDLLEREAADRLRDYYEGVGKPKGNKSGKETGEEAGEQAAPATP